MKITITSNKELINPKLEMSISLEKDLMFIRLISTCPKCSGWGCNTHRHNNDECNSGNIVQNLKPEEVLDTLGSEAFSLLKSTFDKILGSKTERPQIYMVSWLIMPKEKLDATAYTAWFTVLENLANNNPNDIKIHTHMKSIGVVSVDATSIGVKLLKDASCTVNPNDVVSI